MNVEHVMNRDVESCTPESNLAEAAMVMWRRDCGFVPVVENPGGRLVGVITDRDICMATATKHAGPDSLRVGTVMNRHAVTCTPSDDVRTAMNRMSEKQMRRLPVVDREGRLTGVLSLNDLALAAERTSNLDKGSVGYADIAEVLREISAHRVPVQR